GAEVLEPATLPAEMLEAVEARMAEADPQADVRLALTCPACGHAWDATFDIADFFWAELEAWADRMLRDVPTPARTYGWPEPDIPAMSPRRRNRYLELIGA